MPVVPSGPASTVMIPEPRLADENGGRTWARMMTPIIAENGKDPNAFNPNPLDPFPGDPASGHGYSDSREYSDKCYGLVRGLTGGQAGRPWSNFYIGWAYGGIWEFYYQEFEQSYWFNPETGEIIYDVPPDFYDNGTIRVGFYTQAGNPLSIHWFDQEEIEAVLSGATLKTSYGDYPITTEWLRKYYDTGDANLVLYASGQPAPTGFSYYPLLGLTGANT